MTEHHVLTLNRVAQVAIAKGLLMDGDGNLATGGERALGPVLVSCEAGEVVPVGNIGVYVARSGGAIPKMSLVEASAGKAVVHTTGVACGYALEATTGADQEFPLRMV